MQQKQRSKEGRENENFKATSSARQLLTILSACPSTDVEDSDTRQKCRKKGDSEFIQRRMWRGQAGNDSRQLYSSFVGGNSSWGGKREVPNTYFNGISPYIYLHKIIMKNIFFSLLYTPHSPSDFPVFSFLSPVCFLCMSRLCLCVQQVWLVTFPRSSVIIVHTFDPISPLTSSLSVDYL